MLKNKSKPKKINEPKADISVPVVKPNTYNEIIDLDRVKEIQKKYKYNIYHIIITYFIKYIYNVVIAILVPYTR